MKINTMENFDFNKLEIDCDEFVEYYKEGFKEKFHVNYLKYKGGKPLVKIDGNVIFLRVPEDFDEPNENNPTWVSNFPIKVRNRLTKIFQPMIKSYSPQLQSYLNDGYYMQFAYNGGDVPVARKDPDGNVKKLTLKRSIGIILSKVVACLKSMMWPSISMTPLKVMDTYTLK